MSFSATNKHDYIEVVNRAVPEFYRETDYRLYGSEEDVSVSFLGKILKSALQNDLLLTVSGYTKEQVAEFFVPEGKTSITTGKFENKILVPYGLSFKSFSTEAEFSEWITDTLLPDITLNDPSGFFSQVSGYGFGSFSSLELTHEYLIDNLGLFYLFNTSSLTGSTDCSSLIPAYLGTAIYKGQTVTEQEGINMLFRFFWENRDSSTFFRSFIPASHATPASELLSDPYLSGTQMFDAIRVQLEVWTDPKLKDHSFFKASLNAVLSNGPFPSKLRDAGPFQRFLKAVSLGIADINLILEEIGDLLSIDECPQEFLELLANNIGWRFLTGEYGKWRAQLRNAVLLYKAKGSVLGLDAACKLIFPDGIFAASSVNETWESYLPNLLYYLIKTESHIAKEGLEFASIEQMFEGSWPEGVRFNQANAQYINGKDRNYRFLVDGILEHFHNQFSGIVIHGEDFRNLPLWTCLPETENKGFYHRNYPKDPAGEQGFFVSVPPWEKPGFYRECELDLERIQFFCEVLSGSRGDFGFEVDPPIVNAFKTLLTDAVQSTYVLSGTPTLPQNNKFRILTENHQLPPNYEDFVSYGNTQSLKDFDVWNTKSSHLVASFNASSIDFTVDGYDKFRNKAALEVYGDVLKQFIPFHAVLRLVLYLDIEDEHLISDTECVLSEQDVDVFNTEYFNSNRSAFWAGVSGTGNISSTYVNGDGRVLPPVIDFFNVSADDLDRNTSRRRSYRYSIDSPYYVRSGNGMPIAHTLYNGDPTQNPYLENEEYILKGFRYDRQDYEPTSSVVWDNSGFFSSFGDCGRVQQSGDFDLSSLYPVRLPGPNDYQCSSWNIRRDNIDGMAEVIISHALRDNRFFDFSDGNYRGYEFGLSMHRAFDIYQKEFSGNLYSAFDGQKYYGGLNFISHAFGPTLFNHNLNYKGDILQNIIDYPVSQPFLGIPAQGYELIWEFIVGGSQSNDLKYANKEGSFITLPARTYFNNAPAQAAWSPVGFFVEGDLKYTTEVLSGLEIHQNDPDSRSFIVINDDSGSVTNTVDEHSITMFNTDSRPLKLVKRFNASSPLRPQSQQRIEILSKTKEIGEDQVLSIQLTTSATTNDAGDVVEWGYSWLEDRWKPLYLGNSEEFVKQVIIKGDEECPTLTKVNFHTQDTFTLKSIPCGETIRTDDLHTKSTEYLLQVTNDSVTTPQDEFVSQGLTVFEVSVVDRVLENLVEGFDRLDVNRTFTFWDSLGDNYYSRNAAKSQGTFETSGGSRAEYLEVEGNVAAAAAGPITVVKTIGSTGDAGGFDYQTFVEAEADLNNIAINEFGTTNLVSANGAIVLEFSAGLYRQNLFIDTSLITGPSNNVTIRPMTGSEHAGVPGAGVVFAQAVFNGTATLFLRDDHVALSGVEVTHDTNGDGRSCISILGIYFNLHDCIFNQDASSGALGHAIIMQSEHSGVIQGLIDNCLFMGTVYYAFQMNQATNHSGSLIMRNCTHISSASNQRFLGIDNDYANAFTLPVILENNVTNQRIVASQDGLGAPFSCVSGSGNIAAGLQHAPSGILAEGKTYTFTTNTAPGDGDFAIYDPTTSKLLGNPTVVTKTIGIGGAASGFDYASFTEAESEVEAIALAEFGTTDLVAADGAIVFEANAGTYSGNVYFENSLTTDATRQVTYKPAAGSEHGGDRTAGVIVAGGNSYAFQATFDFLRLEGFVCTFTGSYGVLLQGSALGVILDSLIVDCLLYTSDAADD